MIHGIPHRPLYFSQKDVIVWNQETSESWRSKPRLSNQSLEDERRRRRLLEDEEVGRRGPEAAGEPTEKRGGGDDDGRCSKM